MHPPTNPPLNNSRPFPKIRQVSGNRILTENGNLYELEMFPTYPHAYLRPLVIAQFQPYDLYIGQFLRVARPGLPTIEILGWTSTSAWGRVAGEARPTFILLDDLLPWEQIPRPATIPTSSPLGREEGEHRT